MNRNIMATLEAKNKAYEEYLNNLREEENTHAEIMQNLKNEDKIVKENIRYRTAITKLYKNYDMER